MKKISVMIAFVCNPYPAVLLKRTYDKCWKDEVDEVLINVNGRNDLIRNFIIDLWKDDDKVSFVDDVPSEIRQGAAFDRLYPKVTGQVLMTLDSDTYIYRKGSVSKHRDMILNKQYDAIGSTGLHAYPVSIAVMCQNKYGTVRLNPFMSFWRKDVIDKINKDGFTFGTFNYNAGEEFLPLGKLPETGWMDVMAKFSLDYFHFAKKFLAIRQTNDNEYVHMSTISSLYRRKFRSLEDENTQKHTKVALFPWQSAGYWMNCYLLYDMTHKEVPFKNYNKEFYAGFEDYTAEMKLSLGTIRRMVEDFKLRHKGLFEL